MLKEILQVEENNLIEILYQIKRLVSFPNAYRIILMIPITGASSK